MSGGVLWNQVRRDNVDELARCDDFGLLPELREMPWIAGHEVVRASDIGALNEDIVAGVARNEQRADGSHDVGAVSDKIKKPTLQPFANAQFGARKYIPVFREFRLRYI